MSEKKSNSWVSHVRAYAEKNNISYRDAMKQSKDTYKKGDNSVVDKVVESVEKLVLLDDVIKPKVKKPRKKKIEVSI